MNRFIKLLYENPNNVLVMDVTNIDINHSRVLAEYVFTLPCFKDSRDTSIKEFTYILSSYDLDYLFIFYKDNCINLYKEISMHDSTLTALTLNEFVSIPMKYWKQAELRKRLESHE